VVSISNAYKNRCVHFNAAALPIRQVQRARQSGDLTDNWEPTTDYSAAFPFVFALFAMIVSGDF
jgi:hypothetical protein